VPCANALHIGKSRKPHKNFQGNAISTYTLHYGSIPHGDRGIKYNEYQQLFYGSQKPIRSLQPLVYVGAVHWAEVTWLQWWVAKLPATKDVKGKKVRVVYGVHIVETATLQCPINIDSINTAINFSCLNPVVEFLQQTADRIQHVGQNIQPNTHCYMQHNV